MPWPAEEGQPPALSPTQQSSLASCCRSVCIPFPFQNPFLPSCPRPSSPRSITDPFRRGSKSQREAQAPCSGQGNDETSWSGPGGSFVLGKQAPAQSKNHSLTHTQESEYQRQKESSRRGARTQTWFLSSPWPSSPMPCPHPCKVQATLRKRGGLSWRPS